MDIWLRHYHLFIIYGVTAAMFAGMLQWETHRFWRMWLLPRKLRMARHASLWLLGKLCNRALFPLLSLTIAIGLQQKHIGLLNQTTLIPFPIAVVVAVLGLDFVMYFQHRILHRFSWLWRIHRVHHMDKQLDVSTSMRFHPFEALYTMGAFIAGVAFIGASPLAVCIYWTWYNGALLFAHINVRLEPKTDFALRKILVTPGMHRIHHSDIYPELNSNYGFCLSIWDKLFNTYTIVAQSGESKIIFGLPEYRDPKYQEIESLLLIPFNPKRLKHRAKKWPKLEMQTPKSKR